MDLIGGLNVLEPADRYQLLISVSAGFCSFQNLLSLL